MNNDNNKDKDKESRLNEEEYKRVVMKKCVNQEQKAHLQLKHLKSQLKQLRKENDR